MNANTKITLTTLEMVSRARRAGLNVCWDKKITYLDGVQRCDYTQFVSEEMEDDCSYEEIVKILAGDQP